MKKFSRRFANALAVVLIAMCCSLFGCSNEEKYSLSITGGNYLYEGLEDSYKAGEEVQVKVKIMPYENTVASLDGVPLAKAKSSQDDFLTFDFVMPAKNATLDISSSEEFDEDLLVGYSLTFSGKDGNPIEHKGDEGASGYNNYYKITYNEEFGCFSCEPEMADIFSDVKSNVGGDNFELEASVYFTYELWGGKAIVNWIYTDRLTEEIRTVGNAGLGLDDIGYGSIFNSQHLSEIRYNNKGEEYEAKFNSGVKVTFRYIDYLTGVKVLEYDVNNQLIKSSDFVSGERWESFCVSETCEYAVIEEEYTVMNDEERDGEKYHNRTLINKGSSDNIVTLKYPCGNGLIYNVLLSIEWHNETEG